MISTCPYCDLSPDSEPKHPDIIRFGHFRRRSDGQILQRYRCLKCKRSFSQATSHPCFRQKKRQKNEPLRRLLCSGVSQRRAAYLLNISRTTVVRKFLNLAQEAEYILPQLLFKRPQSLVVEFDDMETFEHTKCKPLSITLAVEAKSRWILGFEVSKMPAKGKLAAISRKKYGPRPDERSKGRKSLFKTIAPFIDPKALLKSDENPHYPPDVKRSFPLCRHEAFKGKRGCIVGQGELKKVGFDPLFSLNHTCAKLRADLSRLMRRTWCTTKKPERLRAHLALYAVFHNLSLKTP